MTQPFLIAHRGESRDAPENTLAAVSLAWKRGARAVEIDVRTSADGAAMVMHDPGTVRIGGPRRPVNGQTEAELKALDAGGWKGRRWAGERVPNLREVLATVPRQGILFVELKEGPPFVQPALAAWRASGLPAGQVAFMAFNRETVAVLAREARPAPVSLLLERRDWENPRRLARRLAFAREHALAGLNLEVGGELDARLIEKVHDEGLRVFCWTVNRVRTGRRLLRAGIDGITTDRCAWMRDQLAGEFQVD